MQDHFIEIFVRLLGFLRWAVSVYTCIDIVYFPYYFSVAICFFGCYFFKCFLIIYISLVVSLHSDLKLFISYFSLRFNCSFVRKVPSKFCMHPLKRIFIFSFCSFSASIRYLILLICSCSSRSGIGKILGESISSQDGGLVVALSLAILESLPMMESSPRSWLNECYKRQLDGSEACRDINIFDIVIDRIQIHKNQNIKKLFKNAEKILN